MSDENYNADYNAYGNMHCYSFHEDIDECDLDNGGCDQICTNAEGSFKCSCEPGYALAPNNRSCEGMYVCTLYISTCH